MAAITFDGVTKVYGDGTRAVSGLELEIRDGELVVLVGPSGCGKTTALRMIAGLEEVSDGSLRIGERVVNDLAPRERDVAMVFQNYALYPHLSVFDNIAFGLRLRKTPKPDVTKRVTAAATKLGLGELLDRKPRALSGGQRQRVAMGRAIVREPQAFLMDEPLSNLDAKLRVEMRTEIVRLQRELKATMVYVTHDQVEAMTMGDRVALLRNGVLQQVASPEEIYNRPVNLFVATFIGSPTMNALEATIERDGRSLYAVAGSHRIELDDEALAAHVGHRLIVGIRPEHLEDAEIVGDSISYSGRLRGRVELCETLGSDVLAHVAIDAVAASNDDIREVDDDVGVGAPLRPSDEAVLVCRLHADSRAREGRTIELALQPRKLYFFDPETGFAVAR